ncbi:MAG TPA: YoaK family protein [Solirubrobacteraceae bacterium]|nr:YoaK family protein [Solirubrobacteraceae bacterium]
MSVLREAASTLRPPAGDRHGPLSPLLVGLTFVTGVVDAVSYLKLGHVFVANMTGNVAFLGFALAGAKGLSATASLLALASFLAGALAGGRLGALSPDHRGRMLRAAGTAEAALLAAALIVALASSQPPTTATRYALLVPLALGMGVQNAAAQRLAVPELTTTVLTRTLTGIASEAGVAGGPGSHLGRRLVAVAAILIGALTGGLLALDVSIPAALSLATAIVLAVTLVVHTLSGRRAAWTQA